MKISAFPTLLMLIASAAIAYLAFEMAGDDQNAIVVGTGTGMSVLLTLGCLVGMSLTDHRLNINLKAWSGVAFIVMLIINLCFAGFGVSMPYYVVAIILLLVIHLLVMYKLVLEQNKLKKEKAEALKRR